MKTPILFTTVCVLWASYLLATGQPLRAFDVALGGVIYLGIREVVIRLFKLRKP